MTFKDALRLWEVRTDKTRNSMELSAAGQIKLRLVQLSAHMFAVQVFNTYAVRILPDDTFILTWTLPLSVEMRAAIKAVTGIELSQEGYNQFHEKLNSPAHLDAQGRLIRTQGAK